MNIVIGKMPTAKSKLNFILVMYCIYFHIKLSIFLFECAKLVKIGIECNLIYVRFLTILTTLLYVSHCILKRFMFYLI